MKFAGVERKEIKMIDGIYRTTLAHTDNLMLVHFRLLKGAILPKHSHPHLQAGYVVKGKLEFWEGDEIYVLERGDSYICPENVPHGAKILEDSVVIDAFVPRRDDYV